MNEINTTIGSRVRAARNSMGFAIVDVTSQLRKPITIQQFARYENGGSRWPVDLLVEVAGILHMKIESLCEEEACSK